MLGFARFDLDFIEDGYWALLLPLPILILLMMSSFSLVRVLYQLDLIDIAKAKSTSKLRDGFKTFMVGVPLLLIQIYFLQVGVKAIESFDPDADINKIDERIKFYHENETR